MREATVAIDIYDVIMSYTEIWNVQWYCSKHSCTLHSAHCIPLYTVQCTKLHDEHDAQCTKHDRVKGETIERNGLFDDWCEI